MNKILIQVMQCLGYLNSREVSTILQCHQFFGLIWVLSGMILLFSQYLRWDLKQVYRIQKPHLTFNNRIGTPWINYSHLLTLNPIRDGGKSAIRSSKLPPNDPKFRDFSYFYMTYLKSPNFFLVYHSDFGCLEGVVANIPPPLNVYFQPHPK